MKSRLTELCLKDNLVSQCTGNWSLKIKSHSVRNQVFSYYYNYFTLLFWTMLDLKLSSVCKQTKENRQALERILELCSQQWHKGKMQTTNLLGVSVQKWQRSVTESLGGTCLQFHHSGCEGGGRVWRSSRSAWATNTESVFSLCHRDPVTETSSRYQQK